MADEAINAVAEQPLLTIGPHTGSTIGIRQLWEFRELLFFLIWRDLKVRYKQTVIGVAWALLKPLGTLAIFSVIFGIFAAMPSEGVPYAVFFFTAYLPWAYFADATSSAASSLLGNAHLIGKIYFPRLILPISSVITPLVDFFLSLLLMLGILAWFGFVPSWRIVTLPLFLMFAVCSSFAVGLWLSTLYVTYRDIGHIIPFILQLWMFASPVVYPVSVIPARLRFLYSLNPMFTVIQGFRWALLGKEGPALGSAALSAAIVLGILIGGLLYFKRMEITFADMI
jgi:lipopolysaccharide transport system permease protein